MLASYRVNNKASAGIDRQHTNAVCSKYSVVITDVFINARHFSRNGRPLYIYVIQSS